MLEQLKKFFNLNYYTSELDRFLAELTKKHPKKTFSQQAEFEKHQRISQLRDKKQTG